MADPATVVRSLANVTDHYTFFERDQVLTHRQLNEVVDYLGDQERLTRVSLLGVGVVCGLRASFENGVVVVTKGVGVTTDGDLIRFDEDRRFTKFRERGPDDAIYAPLVASDGNRIPSWELLPEEDGDSRAHPLTTFAATEGDPHGMVAMLLVESQLKDTDLCTSTDCDNLGQQFLHPVKVLLVTREGAASLQERVTTADELARAVPEVVSSRVTLSKVASHEQLVEAFLKAFRVNRAAFLEALQSPGYEAFHQALLSDLDPFPTQSLLDLDTALAFANAHSVQYHYDFINDLIETWNALREQLLGDFSVCCVDLNAFPKHLLLGSVRSRVTGFRTGLYPSRLLGASIERLEHARFLATRLIALVKNFGLPANAKAVRVTPSAGYDRDTEERAIPYYYFATPARDMHMHAHWNFALHRSGRDAYNYSYAASVYSAQGAAARPLLAQIGRFTFFRVEGHLGLKVADAMQLVTEQITTHNLPFAVRAVLLGGDLEKVYRDARPYTDLHRVHRAIREVATRQIKDVSVYTQAARKKVQDDGVAVIKDQGVYSDVLSTTTQSGNEVATSAQEAEAALALAYEDYSKNTSWFQSVERTLHSATRYKAGLQKVTKPPVATPVDALVTTPLFDLLKSLDRALRAKEAAAKRELLFDVFLARHPGMEHFAGVTRGGTFILVHDEGGNVVADFMLPYYLPELDEGEVEDVKGALTEPGFGAKWGVGYQETEAPTKVLFSEEVRRAKDEALKPFVEYQQTVFRDMNSIWREFLRPIPDPKPEVVNPKGPAVKYSQPAFEVKMQDLRDKNESVVRLEEAFPNVSKEQREQMRQNIDRKKKELALAVAETLGSMAADPTLAMMLDASSTVTLRDAIRIVRTDAASSELAVAALQDVSMNRAPASVVELVQELGKR